MRFLFWFGLVILLSGCVSNPGLEDSGSVESMAGGDGDGVSPVPVDPFVPGGCVVEDFVEGGDWRGCDCFPSERLRDNCVRAVGVDLLDPGVCMDISISSVRDGCLFRVARDSGNESACLGGSDEAFIGQCMDFVSGRICRVASDCGGAVAGESFCQDNSVYQQMLIPVCQNARCMDSEVVVKVEDCFSGECVRGVCVGEDDGFFVV